MITKESILSLTMERQTSILFVTTVKVKTDIVYCNIWFLRVLIKGLFLTDMAVQTWMYFEATCALFISLTCTFCIDIVNVKSCKQITICLKQYQCDYLETPNYQFLTLNPILYILNFYVEGMGSVSVVIEVARYLVQKKS